MTILLINRTRRTAKAVSKLQAAAWGVAHLVSGKLIDYIEFDDGFAIAKMNAPTEPKGFTLAESKVRQKYGVTMVGVKSPGRDFTYAQADTRVPHHDLLIVSGPPQLVERFAARP